MLYSVSLTLELYFCCTVNDNIRWQTFTLYRITHLSALLWKFFCRTLQGLRGDQGGQGNPGFEGPEVSLTLHERPFIFIRWRGMVGFEGKGGHEKNTAFREGSSFAVTASVIMQTANMQKRAAFLTCRFSLGSMPLTPYFIMHQKEILPPPKFNKHNKSKVSFIKKKISIFHNKKWNVSCIAVDGTFCYRHNYFNCCSSFIWLLLVAFA